MKPKTDTSAKTNSATSKKHHDLLMEKQTPKDANEALHPATNNLNSANVEHFSEMTFNKYYNSQKKVQKMFTSKMNFLMYQVNQMQKDISVANLDKTRLQKSLTEKDKESQQFKEKCAQLEEQMKTIKEGAQTAKANYYNLELNYDKNLQSAKEENQQLKLNLDEAQKAIKTLMDELAKKKDELAGFVAKIEEAENETKAVEQKYEEKLKTFEQMEKEHKELNQVTVPTLQEEIVNLKKIIEAKDTTIANKMEEIAEQNRVIQNQSDRMSQIERTLVQPLQRVSAYNNNSNIANRESPAVIQLSDDTLRQEQCSPAKVAPYKRKRSKSNASSLNLSIPVAERNSGFATSPKKRRGLPPSRFGDYVTDSTSDTENENIASKRQANRSRHSTPSTVDPFDRLKRL